MQLLQSFSNAVAELADKVSDSVVRISAGRRSGTGVVWSGDGLVVTAFHVIGRSESPSIALGDGREFEAKVVGIDQYSDVALLKVDASGLSPLSLRSADHVRVGEFVLALANALGKKPSATSGIVAGARRMRGFWGAMIEDAVVTDAKLSQGYSGGPLVDASGRLVGMNVAYFAGRGVAVSVEALKETVEKLSRDGRVKKGFLGVVVEPIELPEELARSPDVGQGAGLLVRAVDPGSPARVAGVAMGDIILKLGEAQATDEYELHRALAADVVGKLVTLKVLRGEKATEFGVTPREVEG
jgi:S1-C subfamily serine protease